MRPFTATHRARGTAKIGARRTTSVDPDRLALRVNLSMHAATPMRSIARHHGTATARARALTSWAAQPALPVEDRAMTTTNELSVA